MKRCRNGMETSRGAVERGCNAAAGFRSHAKQRGGVPWEGRGTGYFFVW